jgi:large subunit ribosomal protein L1
MVKHGKKYREAATLVKPGTAYLPPEAVELAKKTARAKFDETVELHLRMGLDPKNAAQQLRGVALLPHGLGKKVRVLVFAQGEAERIAAGAGADGQGWQTG